jgi:hypothetical protein
MLELADSLETAGVDSWHLLRLVPQGRSINQPGLELNKVQFIELQGTFLALQKKTFEDETKSGTQYI